MITNTKNLYDFIIQLTIKDFKDNEEGQLERIQILELLYSYKELCFLTNKNSNKIIKLTDTLWEAYHKERQGVEWLDIQRANSIILNTIKKMKGKLYE